MGYHQDRVVDGNPRYYSTFSGGTTVRVTSDMRAGHITFELRKVCSDPSTTVRTGTADYVGSFGGGGISLSGLPLGEYFVVATATPGLEYTLGVQ